VALPAGSTHGRTGAAAASSVFRSQQANKQVQPYEVRVLSKGFWVVSEYGGGCLSTTVLDLVGCWLYELVAVFE
jgi:hypothetical protein